MPALYKVLGYLGTLPFFWLNFVIYSHKNFDTAVFQVLSMMAYGGMILSFLAGIHWALGLPRQNKVQLCLSMLPTIISFGLIIAFSYTWSFPAPFLVAMGLMFWAMYFIDLKLLETNDFPVDYFVFRRNLTIIVSVSFFILPIVDFLT